MTAALAIPTPDGSGQVTHPDVIRSFDAFAGHHYLMACTPYPFGDDRLENPCLRASDDGVHWAPLAGAPDPLVPPPRDPVRHWSDPDLALVDDVLYLAFRGCVRGAPEADLYYMTTADGVTWSDPVCFYSKELLVSPALAHNGNEWLMWHLESHSRPSRHTSRLALSAGTGLDGLQEEAECALTIPGHVPWHIDVIATDLGWEALCAAYPAGTDASRCSLFHAVSEDGVAFELSSGKPVLRPRRFTWSSRAIYRATMVKNGPQEYRVWYAGGSWAGRWAIGLAEGPIDALRTVDTGGGPSGDTWLEGLRGRAHYEAMHRTPEPVKHVLRRMRG